MIFHPEKISDVVPKEMISYDYRHILHLDIYILHILYNNKKKQVWIPVFLPLAAK